MYADGETKESAYNHYTQGFSLCKWQLKFGRKEGKYRAEKQRTWTKNRCLTAEKSLSESRNQI